MLLSPLAATVALAAPPAEYAWIAGEWHGRTEERWVAAGDAWWGVGLGPEGFEVCRIELVDGRPAYVASPAAATPVVFPDVGGGRVGDTVGAAHFSNPAHDFPQWIRYSRDGDRMDAAIGTLDAPPAAVFRWRRVNPRDEPALVAADGGPVLASGRRGRWGYTIGEGADGAWAAIWMRKGAEWVRVALVVDPR